MDNEIDRRKNRETERQNREKERERGAGREELASRNSYRRNICGQDDEGPASSLPSH